ncbi:MAG TPA: 50S ribosomal protein L5 [Vitreimonas sp.]|nr:50S ribosomal protein L5 [Vitreimonas sp.]
MNRLQTFYQETVAPTLMKEMKYSTVMAIPKIKKVVINTGISQPQEPRARREVVNNVAEQFQVISGQKAQITTARKAISNFKLRKGDPMGVVVTLRSQFMWEFLDKLISVALPRVKDFQGVSRTAFDGQGNYNLGIEEQIIFPEIEYDKIDQVRSLQITVVTSASTNDEARRLLELLGMPFKKA